MKIGRNQPCPCGSGKKYKKCCLNKEKVSSDLLYRRFSEAHDRLTHGIMRFAMETFDNIALDIALDEFMAWPDEGTSEQDLIDHQTIFYSWFMFNWEYESDPEYPQLNDLEDTTLAELYAARKKNRLNTIEAQIIDATARQPFSFYEIQECRPGEGFTVKDVLCGTVSGVVEKTGSEKARKGDILFARLVQLDSIATMDGCGNILIPPTVKPTLIQFRKWMLEGNDSITAETLYDYDIEIRHLYFDIHRKLMTPPELQNTDGDPLSFRTLFYEIDSAEAAFELLKDMAVAVTETELRETAEVDEAGRLIRAEIPWHRKGRRKKGAPDQTLLGMLKIDGRHLRVEVNSARRAETVRMEIETRLGKQARYRTTQIQSADAALEKMGDSAGHSSEPAEVDEELMQDPQVQAHIKEMLFSHWDEWVDVKIPALGHRTPRQAVKDPDGRESVEALLLAAERNADFNEPMRIAGAAAIAKVRRRLGLDKPAGAAVAQTGSGKKKERVLEVKRLIETFGRSRLDTECTGLAVKLCDKIGRMRKLSIERGRVEIWAAAIVYAIAQLNFLFDPENRLYIDADELCDFFGAKKSTVSSKAGLIRKTAAIFFGDPEFTTDWVMDNLFDIFETEDGFLIPGSMIDHAAKMPDPEEDRFFSQFAMSNRLRRENKEAKKSARKPPKKPADDRQLKLFDDEPDGEGS